MIMIYYDTCNFSQFDNEELDYECHHNELNEAGADILQKILVECGLEIAKPIFNRPQDTIKLLMSEGYLSNIRKIFLTTCKNKESEKLILNNFDVGLHFVLELLIILDGNI